MRDTISLQSEKGRAPQAAAHWFRSLNSLRCRPKLHCCMYAVRKLGPMAGGESVFLAIASGKGSVRVKVEALKADVLSNRCRRRKGKPRLRPAIVLPMFCRL